MSHPMTETVARMSDSPDPAHYLPIAQKSEEYGQIALSRHCIARSAKQNQDVSSDGILPRVQK
jgi:hypothetical protein